MVVVANPAVPVRKNYDLLFRSTSRRRRRLRRRGKFGTDVRRGALLDNALESYCVLCRRVTAFQGWLVGARAPGVRAVVGRAGVVARNTWTRAKARAHRWRGGSSARADELCFARAKVGGGSPRTVHPRALACSLSLTLLPRDISSSGFSCAPLLLLHRESSCALLRPFGT